MKAHLVLAEPPEWGSGRDDPPPRWPPGCRPPSLQPRFRGLDISLVAWVPLRLHRDPTGERQQGWSACAHSHGPLPFTAPRITLPPQGPPEARHGEHVSGPGSQGGVTRPQSGPASFSLSENSQGPSHDRPRFQSCYVLTRCQHFFFLASPSLKSDADKKHRTQIIWLAGHTVCQQRLPSNILAKACEIIYYYMYMTDE